mgnify:CR=1 FL=1
MNPKNREQAEGQGIPHGDKTNSRKANLVAVSQTKQLEFFERLSEHILETLKKLSAERQPLTIQSLHKALTERAELVDMIGSLPSSEDFGLPGGPPQADPPEGKDLHARIGLLQEQRDQAVRQVDDLERRAGRLADFLRRTVVTLAGLVRPGENASMKKSLEELKRLSLAGAEIEELEAGLGTLKQSVIQEPHLSERPRSGDGGLWGRWMKRRDPSAKPVEISREVHFKDLQDYYREVLRQLGEELGDSSLERLAEIRQKVNEAESFDHLVGLLADLTSLIQTYTGLIREERKQAAAFIRDIGSSLLQMEARFLSSCSHTSEAHQANRRFDLVLETQMNEIHNSAQLSKSLSEFREVVVNKLTTIRTAMEHKQRDDDIRMEKAKREMEELNKTLRAMKAEIDQIQEKTKSLEQETLTDPLTGAHNQRAYKQRLNEELSRYHRYRQVFSMLLFDIDHFKRVNDEYGHRAGDRCLKEVIKRIRPILRDTDFLARYGGEEFVILLPGIDREAACAVAERLCKMVQNTRFVYQGMEIRITISVGVTQATPSDHTEEAVFNRADRAVYEAKNAGRNRVVAL